MLTSYQDTSCLNNPDVQQAIHTLLKANQLSPQGLFNGAGKKAASLALGFEQGCVQLEGLERVIAQGEG